MKSKYTEIFKLKDMLDKANIEYEFYDRFEHEREQALKEENIPKEVIEFYKKNEAYQIIIRNKEVSLEDCKGDIGEYESFSRLVSVIQSFASYGENLDLLEIMGLVEDNDSDVEGFLKAEEVFRRIEKALSK